MEVNYSFDELKDFIKKGKNIYCGEANTFVYYNGILVKFYSEMYKMFKYYDLLNEEQIMRLFLNKNGEIVNTFVDFNKLRYFREKAPNIKLSTLPQEAFYFNDIPVGIIQPYFSKHKWLHFLEDLSYKEMYYLLRNILLELHELEENGIYQLNINRNNIVYNGIKPELVDLCSSSVSYGDKKGLEQHVYGTYLDFLYSLLYCQCFDSRLYREFTDILTIDDCTFEVCEDVVKRLEKKF